MNFECFYNYKENKCFVEPSVIFDGVSIHPIPVKNSEKAFSILKQKMYECLSSLCSPNFHIFSGDCGTGKSTAVHNYIKDWKDEGFPGDGSVIIFLGSFKEVDAYIIGCGLSGDDFACVSPDPKYSAFGLGRAQADKAKVIFVTHKQAWRRTLETGSFEAIDQFHYHGRPRSLRLWDESLTPALPVSFRLDLLNALPAIIRVCAPELAHVLDKLRVADAGRAIGRRLSFPFEIGKLASACAYANKGWLPKDFATVLDNLISLAGREALLRKDNRDGWIVVGISGPIPDDLAPLIVLDASARLRPIYDMWADRASNVTFLPPASADYRQARFHWWDKGASKSTLQNPSDRRVIITAVADLISSKPDDSWLVIHHMDRSASGANAGYSIKSELAAMLPADHQVEFLHWGGHLAANDYRHHKNVIILGGLHYAHHTHEAIYMAGMGKLVDVNVQGAQGVAGGEFVQHVYQAACRSNIRNLDDDGIAGNADIYLIAARRDKCQPLLEKAFPGCSIEEWEPVQPKRKAKATVFMETVLSLFTGECRRVLVRDVATACGGKDTGYLKTLWTMPKVIRFMKERGIRRRGHSLECYSF